jgi:hypothetical protein
MSTQAKGNRMNDYTLINHRTGEAHPFDFENIVDIRAALRAIESKSGYEYVTGGCWDDTFKRWMDIQFPMTDY